MCPASCPLTRDPHPLPKKAFGLVQARCEPTSEGQTGSLVSRPATGPAQRAPGARPRRPPPGVPTLEAAAPVSPAGGRAAAG